MLQSLNSSTTPMPPLSSLLSASPGPFTSCGMENQLIIQRPPEESFSFDWSDFPVVCHNADVDLFPAPRPVQTIHNSCNEVAEDPPSETQAEYHFRQHIRVSRTASDANEETTEKKRVSFSPSLEVRTHSVILGDHPFCRGLALELGWEHSDTEYISLDSHEHNKPRFCSRRPVRLSFLERKNVLKRIGGLSERDLKDAMGGQTSCLRHAAPVSNHLSMLSF